jgi:hypothetical protein
MRISSNWFNGGQDVSVNFNIDRYPDVCPLCGSAGQMQQTGNAYIRSSHADGDEGAQILLQCPKQDCRKFFVAYYKILSQQGNIFGGQYTYSKPRTYTATAFPQNILDVSPEFVEIYNQAEKAENDALGKIAGVGYRKSFEFLIKDYLISKTTDEASIEKIKSKSLGKCIEQDISNDNIKTVAARATWLGNDETHYLRIWSSLDIADLKQLINLSVYWIDSETITANLIKDMPDPKK